MKEFILFLWLFAGLGALVRAGTLPDPKLTPGDTLKVTKEDVCKPGYSKRVRHVSGRTKHQVFAEYGIPFQHHARYEVDHLISLELGGSNDIKNLWPEAYLPKPGAHEKDKVEDWLHEQVCKGNMTLEAAQDKIRGDWTSVYLHLETK